MVIRLAPLTRKLGRDLLRLRAQGSAVVILLALGVSLLVSSIGTRDSLGDARDDYYAVYHFADLQLPLVRAPLALTQRIAELPDVQALEARVAAPGLLALADTDELLNVRVLSLDEPERTQVNRPWLVSGNWPDPRIGADQVLVNEGFALARGLRPGDTLTVTIRGSRVDLTLVGIANSPEFVFITPPGEALPQADRFAVLWMPRRALEQAAGMQGAFNDLVLRVGADAQLPLLSARLQQLLAPYGAGRPLDRSRIPSARFVDQELDQLATMATLLPPAFLLVSAFLLNITLTRLVEAERSNIGLLKAFGLRSAEIARGYLAFALCLAALGVVLGIALAQLLGSAMCAMYLDFFRLPELQYRASLGLQAGAAGVAVLAAVSGSLVAVRRVMALRPAEALSPAPPPAFKGGDGVLAGAVALLDPLTRIVFRRIKGYPRRAAATVAGVSCALALLVLAMQLPMSIERLLELTFREAKRQDLTLSLVERDSRQALNAIAALPGVQHAEPFLAMEASFQFAGVTVDEGLLGWSPEARYERLVDVDGRVHSVRDDGLLITAGLARQLDVQAGQRIKVQLTSGRRAQFEATVVAVAEVTVGGGAYMDIDALGRLIGEPGRISGAHLRIDPLQRERFIAAVDESPAIVAVSDVNAARASIQKIFDEGTGTMTVLFTSFAVLMAGGIAYATSSVTLAEQRSDLATLQVLGYSRPEASYILLAELALLSLLALPIGLIAGQLFSIGFMRAMATDIFTFPLVLSPQVHLKAALIVLIAVLVAGLIVRRGVDRIALADSLKSRE